MTATKFRELHRIARLGNLGTLTCMAGELYDWFLTEVYDLRFPHVGDKRYLANTQFDSYRGGFVRRIKQQRLARYAAGIKLCRFCKGYHHIYRECPRHDGN